MEVREWDLRNRRCDECVTKRCEEGALAYIEKLLGNSMNRLVRFFRLIIFNEKKHKSKRISGKQDNWSWSIFFKLRNIRQKRKKPQRSLWCLGRVRCLLNMIQHLRSARFKKCHDIYIRYHQHIISRYTAMKGLCGSWAMKKGCFLWPDGEHSERAREEQRCKDGVIQTWAGTELWTAIRSEIPQNWLGHVMSAHTQARSRTARNRKLETSHLTLRKIRIQLPRKFNYLPIKIT